MIHAFFFKLVGLTSSCFLSGAVFTPGMCVLDAPADFGAFFRGLPPPDLQVKRVYCALIYTTLHGSMNLVYNTDACANKTELKLAGEGGGGNRVYLFERATLSKFFGVIFCFMMIGARARLGAV